MGRVNGWVNASSCERSPDLERARVFIHEHPLDADVDSVNELRAGGRWDGRWRQGLHLPPPRIHHAALVLRQSRQCRRTGRRAKPFCRFMLNVARGTRSLALGGVLCRPGQTGERAVRGVSDPLQRRADGPSRGPGGRSRLMCRRMCHRGSAAAAAHTCAARSPMRSPRRQRALVTCVLVAVHGLLADEFCSAFLAASFRHRHMACGTPRRQVLGLARAAPTCRPSRVTA